ncbi:MAG: hypothetical protein GX444_02240 [Myxococcales bacterium]|nr:hypothetical protein [Myxococcales bacterium]
MRRFSSVLLLGVALFLFPCCDRIKPYFVTSKTTPIPENESKELTRAEEMVPTFDLAPEEPIAPVGIHLEINAPSWCLNMGQLPPEAGWRWKNITLGTYSMDTYYNIFMAFAGDTLFVVWTIGRDDWGRGYSSIGKWENNEWQQWEVFGPGDANAYTLGAATDAEGRLWTVLWDPYNELFSTDCSLVRWQKNEIVEVIPVSDDWFVDFTHLFILPDGRFAFTFDDSGYQYSMIMETTDGQFVKAYPNLGTYTPDSEGIFHHPVIIDNGWLFEDYGNPLVGFQRKFVGRVPNHLSGISDKTGGQAGINANGRVTFSTWFIDLHLWLISYQGHKIVSVRWPGLDVWDNWDFSAMDVDPLGRPYGAVSLFGDAPFSNCFFRYEAEGVRTEYFSGGGNNDVWVSQVAASETGAVAVLGPGWYIDPEILNVAIRYKLEGESHE